MATLLPRHAAGSMELKEGTGGITGMCSIGDFLEIYKIDKTFRVQTPEASDPHGHDPGAWWTASPIADVGSGNPIIARVLLQSVEALNFCSVERLPVIKVLHTCKEVLVSCEVIARRVCDRIDATAAEIQVQLDTNPARALNPFPQVPDLQVDCSTFFVLANRCLKSVCELPALFLQLPRVDSNFDHLADRLAAAIGDTPLTAFVRGNAQWVRYLIELRNFDEHPRDMRTIVRNFHLHSGRQVGAPTWQIEGGEQPAAPIRDQMPAAVSFLLGLAEDMVVYLVERCSSFPLEVGLIPEAEIRNEAPFKYRFGVDLSRMRFVQETDAAGTPG